MTDEPLIDEPVEELSLRDDLAAAIEEHGGMDPEPAPVAAAAAPTQDRVRAPDGKFAKAGEAAQIQPKTEPLTSRPATEAPKAPIGAPVSWTAAAKADFDKLPEHIKSEVLKREADIETGLAQQQQGAQRLNRLDEILAPRRERFQLAGIDEVAAVRALFAAQDLLERDPVNALMFLARQSGVDFRGLVQRMAGQQPQQAQLPPQFQPLLQQVQTLTDTVAQQQQAAEQAKLSGYKDQVRAFGEDPKNVYFENVRAKMGTLIRTGQAASIEDAYAQATWSDPEIRPLLLRQQTEEQQAKARTNASAKATEARRASGSVIGSPTPGATPGRGGPAPTLRDELQAAFNAAL